ncbi:NitT/TauT family transport system permease protein [Xanthobacter flavus]|uniref:ABC transporter permease n=1 Tax=Xanthobacter flavus TaxID=281 RepID=A0A9W6FI36_XANFL|nr:MULTISPECIES: ABC transporter permease subunit [Xanthobacter]MDR6333533.1 NitT/TauT family transport system permease protein [Xanthobacter flavus]GLI20715.1 ABC transporter permease [Xanthobacter flavus]
MKLLSSGTAARAASLVLLLLAWEITATLAHSRALPAPHAVFAFIGREASGGDLVSNIAITLARVVVSFVVAMALGCAIGVALGRSRRLDTAFDTWVIVLLNTPALVITVLCYIWLGLTEAAAVLAVALNKIPTVAVLMREGTRALSPELDEMASAFRLSPMDRLRHVLIPQLQPHIAGAARSGLALVWKIVLVVELLGRPNGVGYAISVYFQLFDVTAVLGYSLAFMSVMLAIEYGVLQPYEAHVRRWRLTAH